MKNMLWPHSCYEDVVHSFKKYVHLSFHWRTVNRKSNSIGPATEVLTVACCMQAADVMQTYTKHTTT